MTREELYAHLCSTVKGGRGGHAGYVRRSMPEVHAKLTKALGEDYTTVELYCYLKRIVPPVCGLASCENLTRFLYFSTGYKRFCSVSCAFKCPSTHEKSRGTLLTRTGGKYTHHSQLPEYREANSALKASDDYKATLRARKLARTGGKYGHHAEDPAYQARRSAKLRENELVRSGGLYSHHAQRPERKASLSEAANACAERRVATYVLNELGRSNGNRVNTSQRRSVRRKISEAHLSHEVKEAKKRTCLERYGVPFASQNPEVHSKALRSRFAKKQVTVAGRNLTMQGFEPQVFLSIEDKIDKIVTSPKLMPELWYTQDGRRRRYFPDARVLTFKGNKLLVEVKSTFTLFKERERNLLKFTAARRWCSANEYTFLLAVYQRKTKKVTWIENPRSKDMTKLLKEHQ